jgi:hypothetical protein
VDRRTDAYTGNPRFGTYAVDWDPVNFGDAVVLQRRHGDYRDQGELERIIHQETIVA